MLNATHYYYETYVYPTNVYGSTKEETITPGTDTLAITMNPRSTDRMVKSYIDKTSENASVYNAWFNAIHEKYQIHII